jgi:beta-galactosidase
LPEPVTAERPLNFEAMNFGYGAAVYLTTLSPADASELEFETIHDYAVIMIDGKKVGILDRRTGTNRLYIPALKKEAKLVIILEAMGRVNFGKYVQDKKGIIGKVYRRTGNQQEEIKGWTMYPVNIEDGYPHNFTFTQSGIINTPALYRGTFNITRIGDTFLDMSNWGKGLVWINGHGLGRFWKIGPTQTMYLPGPWLKEGENEIIVLDYLSPESLKIKGFDKPVLDSLRLQ